MKAQVDEIRAERSIDAAAQAEPFHRQVAVEIVDALDALFAALKREEQIRRIVTDVDYDDRLQNFQGTVPTSCGNYLARFGERVREYSA